jgi:hypothetical protein
MPFNNTGNQVPSRVTFNQGTLNFGSSQIVMVDNLALTVEDSIVDLYVLGSIIAQDKVRHSLKVSLTGMMKSFSPEMDSLFFGNASSGVSPSSLYFLDGQPTLQSPVLTIYDRNNNEIQYQFIGALFKSEKMTFKAEEFGTWEFTLEAKNVVEVYS